jgi:peptidoglycan/xylan/chitin deacetylase (PgdA/CDA1 family)
LGQEKTPRRLDAHKKSVSAPAVAVVDATVFSGAGQFSLTFDDGPHPVHTPALLDWLKKHHIRATFFVLGENAERHPHLVKRMVAEGHAVANHSWSHPNLRFMSSTRMLQQVRRTHDLIQKLTGRAPTAFRPPYGSLSASQRALIEKEFGYQVVLWTVDTLDWKHRNSSGVTDILRTQVKDRSIVLAHDIHGRILPALVQLLPQWRRAGLQPVLLGALVSLQAPARLITSR